MKSEEMEKAPAIDNSGHLFRFIKETRIENPAVNETTSEKNGTIIHSRSRKLDRWAEHFTGQFNWPSVTHHVQAT